MSQRKRTAPPTPKHSRSSHSGRKGLIAKEKTKKQSAKKRTALDNRFHRTSDGANRGVCDSRVGARSGWTGARRVRGGYPGPVDARSAVALRRARDRVQCAGPQRDDEQERSDRRRRALGDVAPRRSEERVPRRKRHADAQRVGALLREP